MMKVNPVHPAVPPQAIEPTNAVVPEGRICHRPHGPDGPFRWLCRECYDEVNDEVNDDEK